MTQKELLYIEDALNHCQFFNKKAKEAISAVKNEELKDLAYDLEEWSTDLMEKIYELVS